MKKRIAHIVLETTTPLVIGAGKSAINNDALVATDFNGLPYIPATSIVGVLRSLVERNEAIQKKILFGGEDEQYQNNEHETFKGSVIACSDALLVNPKENNIVYQTLVEKLNVYPHYLNLPKREHVAIDDKGTARDRAKYDNQFVYVGTRFKFEIEADGIEEDDWKLILNAFYCCDFLLGSGTTNGYGQTKVISIEEKTFTTVEEYLNHTVDLNQPLKGSPYSCNIAKSESDWTEYKTLAIKTNAIHIGAGYGDRDVDDALYKEEVYVRKENKQGEWKTHWVIPGSSIKGVLAHRVAYYFNKDNKNNVEELIERKEQNLKADAEATIKKQMKRLKSDIKVIENSALSLHEKLEEIKKIQEDFKIEDPSYEINAPELFAPVVLENNEAVKAIFGKASNVENDDGTIGNLIVNDVYIPYKENGETIFEHNSIDRFTGGTIESALFSEKVFAIDNGQLVIKQKGKIDVEYEEYLTKAINDLCNGDLPIGGKTTKGYGFLTSKEKTNEY